MVGRAVISMVETEVGLPEPACGHSSIGRDGSSRRSHLLLLSGVCLEVSIVVMGENLLVAGEEI